MKIGIVGLGLIGGSIGLDLRAKGFPVVGVSRQAHICQEAVRRGVVDSAGIDLKLLATTDLIFICTPIGAIVPTVKQLVSHLTIDTVLTDVGSVKTAVVEAIVPLWQNFVGGHPMAGRAESGLDAAEPNMFAGKAYILTPTDATPRATIEVVQRAIFALEAKYYQCRPEDHDSAVAWISHLPVFSSASLISACLQETDPKILALAEAFASSGFRDTSRVGGGSPELGMMMAQYNQVALLRSLSVYRSQLDQVIAEIEQANWTALEQRLQQTQVARPQFLS